MKAEHLKEWLAEARKKEMKEAAAEQATLEEEEMELPNGGGGWGGRIEGGIFLKKCPTGGGWLI